MTERTLATRYARALLGLAAEQKKVDEVEAELRAVAELYRESAEFRAAMEHPSLSRSRRVELVKRLLAGRVSELVLGILGVIVERGRLPLIGEIATIFDLLSDELQGIVKVRVTSFRALKDEHRQKLLERLSAWMKRRPVLREEVDPSILGGIIVRIGDDVLDGSVRGRMRALKEKLTSR
jgi:F-type H+-transporting ATPase subunit delta